MSRPIEAPSTIATFNQTCGLGAYLAVVSSVALLLLILLWPSSEVMSPKEADRDAAIAEAEVGRATKGAENFRKVKDDAETKEKETAEKLKEAIAGFDAATAAAANEKLKENAARARAHFDTKDRRKQDDAAAQSDLDTLKRAQDQLAVAVQKKADAEKSHKDAADKVNDAEQNLKAAEASLKDKIVSAGVAGKIADTVQAIGNLESRKLDQSPSIPHVYRDATRCPFRNSAASFYCSRQAAGFVGFGRCRYGEQSHPGHSNMDVTYAFPIRGNRRANGSSARSIGKLGSSGLHSPGLGLSMPANSSCRRQGPSHQPSNRCRVRLSSPHRRGVAQPLPLKRIGWPPGRAAVGTTATIFPPREARSDQFGEQHNRTARLSRHPLVAG